MRSSTGFHNENGYYVLMANIIFHLKNKLNLTILFQIDKQISLEASKSISWLWTLCSGWYNVNFIFHYYCSLFSDKSCKILCHSVRWWWYWDDEWYSVSGSRQLIGWDRQVSYHSRTWCNVLTRRSLTLVPAPGSYTPCYLPAISCHTRIIALASHLIITPCCWAARPGEEGEGQVM